MIVKICGITRREDAVAAVEAGASAIGFIFYKSSPRYVTPEKARELGEALDVWKVGVFVDETPEFVDSAASEARLDIVQIYGPFRIHSQNLRRWRAVRVPASGGFGLGVARSEAIFLDSSANGVSFDWRIAKRIAESHKVVIAGGLDASNVGEAIRIAEPWGVDASSRLESAPGIKDNVKVRQFIEAARVAAVQGTTAREIS